MLAVGAQLTFKFVLDLKALPQSSHGKGLSVVCTTAAWRVNSDLVPNERPHCAHANSPPPGPARTPPICVLSDPTI